MAINFNQKVYDEVVATGLSVNEVIENMYGNEINEKRKDKRLANKSAVKLALIDKGIRGNMTLKNMFTTNDDQFMFPAYVADLIETAIAKSDIMSYLISGEMEIDGTVIEAPTLNMLSDDNKKKLRKKRVVEGGEFPTFTIKTGEKVTRLFKKGIRLNQTYEASRNMRIDLFTKALEALTNDIVNQNVEEATKVLEASTITSLGTTTPADTITNDELLDAIFDYVDKYGYAPTTILAPKDLYRSLYKMVYSTEMIYGMSEKLKLNFPTVKIEDLNVVPADVTQKNSKNRVLMYNKEYSLTRYVERGSALQEQATNILNQSEDVVVSEVSGYANFVESVGEIVSA